MNPDISDPDTKINMSLDEIIRLTQGNKNKRSRRNRIKRKKKQSLKNNYYDHSVPLFTSSEGMSIYVSKKSPLLTPDFKQSFIKTVANRALNAELLNESTKVIPAKYKLVKTDYGVEKILVPVKNYICKPLRKLHKKNASNKGKTFKNEVPPQLATTLFKPVTLPLVFKKQLSTTMEVDAAEDNDDVVLKYVKREPETIDVDMNMPITISENKSPMKTLHDRFTRMTGNLRF